MELRGASVEADEPFDEDSFGIYGNAVGRVLQNREPTPTVPLQYRLQYRFDIAVFTIGVGGHAKNPTTNFENSQYLSLKTRQIRTVDSGAFDSAQAVRGAVAE